MKKKIINGILLVAMLFAATTSFVSCKDNVDDQIVGVYDQLAKQKNELSARIDNLEGQISTLQSELNNVKTDVSSIKSQIATLQSDVNDLKGRLAAVESQIATLSAEVDTIKSDLAALTERVNGIENNVEKLIALLANGMITEIATNQTVNDVFGTINIPGFNAKVLAALFGDNQTYIEKFPATGADYNVDPDGDVLVASDIAGAKFIELYDDYITKPNGNAGKFFFTANSLDKSLFDINDWTLSLEASDGTVAPVYFENVQPSDYNVQWGAYKSVVLGSNEAETDLGFYEADATIDRAYLEQCKLNARNYVNFGQLKNDIKTAIENIKAANGKKATLVSIAKEAAKLVENYVSGQLSGDNRYLDNPTYSAQRLVMTKTIEDVAVRFQDADLDVALTAIAPLSYNSFWQLEKDAKGINMNLVERAVNKLAKAIKARIPSFGNGEKITIGEIKLASEDTEPFNPVPTQRTSGWLEKWNAETSSWEYEWHDDLAAEGYDTTGWTWFTLKDEDGNTIKDENGNTKWYCIGTIDYYLDPIAGAIKDGLNLDKLNEMLEEVSGVPTQLANTVDNLSARFTSFIERISNAYVSAMKNHALTRAVSPIILYNTTNGIKRMVDGITVKAGIMQINMTSATEEIIVPPYEKYIAVKDASGKITESATVPGNTQRWDLNLTKAGDYTVILSCVDYYGYVVTKKYEITVK